jgi:hypothetical protein
MSAIFKRLFAAVAVACLSLVAVAGPVEEPNKPAPVQTVPISEAQAKLEAAGKSRLDGLHESPEVTALRQQVALLQAENAKLKAALVASRSVPMAVAVKDADKKEIVTMKQINISGERYAGRDVEFYGTFDASSCMTVSGKVRAVGVDGQDIETVDPERWLRFTVMEKNDIDGMSYVFALKVKFADQLLGLRDKQPVRLVGRVAKPDGGKRYAFVCTSIEAISALP